MPGHRGIVENCKGDELASKAQLAAILLILTGHCPIDIDIHTARLKIQSVPFSIILLQLYFVTNLLFTSVFAAAQTM